MCARGAREKDLSQLRARARNSCQLDIIIAQLGNSDEGLFVISDKSPGNPKLFAASSTVNFLALKVNRELYIRSFQRR